MHISSLKKIGGLILAISATFAALPAFASTPRIGFWAGESITPCLGGDPVSCPRNLSSYTPQLWNLLKTNNSFLYVDLIYGSDFGPAISGVNQRSDGLTLMQQANANGVPVSVWITVPISYGTFANAQNGQTIQAAVKAFKGWQVQNNLQVDQAVLDLEFPLGDQVLTEFLQGNLAGAENLLLDNLDPSTQCTAVATYRDTITWAHQNGLKLSGSPLPFSLADVANGNMALQNALNIVNFPPFGYDQLYLQSYRAEGIDLGSGYVASTYQSMQQYFGAKGQVSLGSTGLPPYNTVDPVVTDVRMLAGLGATTIPIFDLDGSVSAYGLNGIQQIFNAAQNPMSGAELANATQLSLIGSATLQAYDVLQKFAATATPLVSFLDGHAQQPNAYPNGCGN